MTANHRALRSQAPDPANSHLEVRELVLPDRVHGSIYTNPTLFTEEMRTIFHQGWVFVGHASEIPTAGDFRTTTIGQQPVIFVRGDDDVVRVLLNRCTHRGTALCVEEAGNSRRFTCAYHGWSYRTTGELHAVPQIEQYDGLDRSMFGLRPAARVATYREFVFASLGDSGQPFDDYLTVGARAYLDLVTDVAPDRRLQASAGVHKYGYDGNWKLQAENSVDAYHVPFVHRSFLQIHQRRSGQRLDSLTRGASPVIVRDLGGGHVGWDYRPINEHRADLVRPHTTQSAAERSHVDALVARDGREAAAELLRVGAAHAFIFPNLALIASQLRVIRPVTVDRTEVYLYPTLLAGAPDEVNEHRLRSHEAFYGPAGGGQADDLEIFARQQHGLDATVDPWCLIAKGMGREWHDADGRLSGYATDELASRTILGHWATLMAGAPCPI
ncbi:Rieske 2Fe-2S domain-containing protein [Jatrophihabitans cynanchi]|uniref:Rieske 2Fe-2S domain-containing protein n=1 Tax=Jatrophihabitans cynanchi TaxID=2944128 RepID=A0ABY7K153_9ACTN|nr:Rieske 2Fe-2S domain-containing protein [Jatrophihabitans sp. SB3-54]WAX58399.1 Rieske 2Fe-2S domain-containing protein [Jatrophihabitans sp. SB3-54]